MTTETESVEAREAQDSLNYSYDSFDKVPEKYRDLYEESDDGSAKMRGIAGAPSFDDIERLKKALKSEREIRRKMEADFNASRREDHRDDEGEQRREDKLKRQADREIEAMKKQLQETQAIVDSYKKREKAQKIESAVRKLLDSSDGVLRSAYDDAILLARYSLDVDEDGDIVTTADASVGEGFGIDAWFREVRATKRHWWGADAGVTLSGGKNGASSQTIKNPWKKDSWNVTEQLKITLADPKLADQLKKMA